MDAGIGNPLTSWTTTINTFRLPPAVGGDVLASLGDTSKIVLVDTPGFSPNKPDYELFEMVAQWLKNVSVVRFFGPCFEFKFPHQVAK